MFEHNNNNANINKNDTNRDTLCYIIVDDGVVVLVVVKFVPLVTANYFHFKCIARRSGKLFLSAPMIARRSICLLNSNYLVQLFFLPAPISYVLTSLSYLLLEPKSWLTAQLADIITTNRCRFFPSQSTTTEYSSSESVVARMRLW